MHPDMAHDNKQVKSSARLVRDDTMLHNQDLIDGLIICYPEKNTTSYTRISCLPARAYNIALN